MKSVFSILIAASISLPAFALNVNNKDVAAANGPATDLTLAESIRLRTKISWARLTLFEINKNERLFGLVHADRSKRGQIVVAMSNTAVVAGLAAATVKLAQEDIVKIKFGEAWENGMGTYKHREALKALRAEAKNLDQQVATATRPLNSMYSGDVRTALKREVEMDQWMRGKAREMKFSPIQNTARGLRMVLAVGLVLTLAQDLTNTWIQISMTPEQVEQKKADLQNFINDGEQQLADDARQD